MTEVPPEVRPSPVQVPVLYCDIDGTLRLGKDELGVFVNTKEDVVIFPEVPDLLKAYKLMAWRVIGISNQGGIGLGHMSEQDCIDAMNETIRQTGGQIDKIIYCPHKPDEGCDCRKPKTGMIENGRLWMSANYNFEAYPLEMGVFVGDRPEDAECAANAGLRFIEAAEWRKGTHLDEIVAEALKQ